MWASLWLLSALLWTAHHLRPMPSQGPKDVEKLLLRYTQELLDAITTGTSCSSRAVRGTEKSSDVTPRATSPTSPKGGRHGTWCGPGSASRSAPVFVTLLGGHS
jgi:hypothetical protein